LDPTKEFIIQLRPQQNNSGGDWANALGSWTPHQKIAWNEQAAIIIMVCHPLAFSLPALNIKITDWP
jgi:hypothetical protein